MSNFLTDILVRDPSKVKGLDQLLRPAMINQFRTMRQRVLNARCFSFDPTALALAADLRIDTADRLQRVTESLTSRPGSYFLEADYTLLNLILARLRGIPRNKRDPDLYEPERIGYFVDILPNGTIELRLVWTIRASEQYTPEIRQTMKRLGGNALLHHGTVNGGQGYMVVDPSIPHKYDNFQALVASEDYVMHTNLPKEVYNNTRLNKLQTRINEIADVKFDEDSIQGAAEIAVMTGLTTEQYWVQVLRNFSGEIFHMLALLSVVHVETKEVFIERRQVARENARRQKESKNPFFLSEELQIISMRAADLGIQKRYEQIARGEDPTIEEDEPMARPDREGSNGPIHRRRRHFVQGHMFVARNKQLTYRSPHWRGGSSTPVLTRLR